MSHRAPGLPHMSSLSLQLSPQAPILGSWVGWAGEERQSLLEPSAPKAAAKKSQQSAPQHQQLRPQNTQHWRGCARHSAKPWGWLESGANQGKAGFQNLPGLCVGLSPIRGSRQKVPRGTLPSDPAMSLVGFLVRSAPPASSSRRTERPLGVANCLRAPGNPSYQVLSPSQSGGGGSCPSKAGLEEHESPPQPFLPTSDLDKGNF